MSAFWSDDELYVYGVMLGEMSPKWVGYVRRRDSPRDFVVCGHAHKTESAADECARRMRHRCVRGAQQSTRV